MPITIANIQIPNSETALEAAQRLRARADDQLFNHSLRAFFFGSLEGMRNGLTFDPEILFLASVFHDIGLCDPDLATTDRFEIDSANSAREFMRAHHYSDRHIRLVWDAIALQATPGIPQWKEPEVALLARGVEMDVTGIGFEKLAAWEREEILMAFPREGFDDALMASMQGGADHRNCSCIGRMIYEVGIGSDFQPEPHPIVNLIGTAPWMD